MSATAIYRASRTLIDMPIPLRALRVSLVLIPVVLGAVACGGQSAEQVGRQKALDEAAEIARSVEAIGAHPSGDPGTPEYRPPVENAGLVRLIGEKVRAQSSDAGSGQILSSRSMPGWTGELGVVDSVLYTTGIAGGGWSYEDADVTTCIRFRILGERGPRRVTTEQIKCPSLPSPSTGPTRSPSAVPTTR